MVAKEWSAFMACFTVIRGPREGFIENLQTNISLIRRKVRNKNLVVEVLCLGQRTNTEVAVVYIKG